MIKPEAWELGSPKEGEFSTVLGANRRRVITLVSALLTGVGSVVAFKLTESLKASQSWLIILAWLAAGASVTYLLSRLKERSDEDSPEAIKTRVGQLHSELRSQVQSRSYGARSKLIAAPLTELDLDITPRVGLVRDPRLTEPEPISEEGADIIAAFTSSKRRLLIVGEPGAGKTTAAYDLIEHLDEREGDERVTLLVNLSAWEAQENFEAFLVDYLLSEVGYQVRERAVANAFIGSDRFTLILDGLDEIPAKLRTHFSECLDEFVRGLPSEVGVVVTCRTHEYEELLRAHPTGLGLVQAVEMLPLTSQQLDSALGELLKFADKDWEIFLTQRHLMACQRARDLLSSPLFLNLAVAGRLHPRELLACDEEQELRDLVLDRYLDRVLGDKSEYGPQDARRYLSWIARFLNGAEVSPFGLKTTDSTVFDFADLTPPDLPRRYRLFEALSVGLAGGLIFGLVERLGVAKGLGLAGGPVLIPWLGLGLGYGLVFWLVCELLLVRRARGPYKRSAASSRVTIVWPSTRQQLFDFFGNAARGFLRGLIWGLISGVVFGLLIGVPWALSRGSLAMVIIGGPMVGLMLGLLLGVMMAPVFGLIFGLVGGLISRPVLITSRTPHGASSRSLVASLLWLSLGLGWGLVSWLCFELSLVPVFGLELGLSLALVLGLVFGLHNGGGFVLLQHVAHRHLARAGKLPRRPYVFLEWGIEQQIFRRVGGGVRFRHSLLQQHLASTSADFTEITAASRSD